MIKILNLQYGSPLEQFEIFPIFEGVPILKLLPLINCLYIYGIILSVYTLYITNFWQTYIPTRIQLIFEFIYNTVYELCSLNIGKKGSFIFPLIFVTFIFILFYNLIGMVPYSFTITSHLIVTFALALMIYIGLNIIGINIHYFKFLTLLLPNGASIFLVPLLIPIELVSYIFRVISLPVRLFANMMAGHTLLKVIAGFSWSMVGLNGIMFLLHFIPLAILVLLIGLEFGVAIIQAFVFTILVCIYVNEAINLH